MPTAAFAPFEDPARALLPHASDDNGNGDGDGDIALNTIRARPTDRPTQCAL
jgi:hypothetical protein